MSNPRKTILIVDDSPLIIERLTELLQELQYIGQVVNAVDYKQAVALLKKENIDIALLDIQLPGANGIALLQFIKINYPAIKSIMLSNEATGYHRKICKKEGAFYFIDKSKEFESIPEILSSLI